MQYFVSAENTSYFYWQLELLIESFAMLGVEDSLVIALAENDSRKTGGFSTNLVKHKNKFVHPNTGRDKGYLPLNRIEAIRYALAYGALDFPFALIHADMVLKRPIEEPKSEFPLIVLNNFDESMGEEEAVKGEIKGPIQELAESRGVEFESIPKVPFLSPPTVFNKAFSSISEVFFSKVQVNMTDIVMRRGVDFPCEKAAWELAISESFQHCEVTGRFMAAPLLFESDDVNLIHYKAGIPPVFHKKFYKYEEGNYFAGQGPYETLVENNPTVCTDYMQAVIKSYVNNRAKAFRPDRERQTSHADARD